jgi:hypothetical protein
MHKKMVSMLVVLLMTCSLFSANAQSSENTTAVRMQSTTLRVKGITCATDLKMIAANVEKLEGVLKCIPGKTGTTTSFQIEYDAEKVTEPMIRTAIENTPSCERPDEKPYRIKQ